MPAKWYPLPVDAKWFTNVDESVLSRANAAIENAFVNESGGHTRFPGLRLFADLGGKARVYLHDWQKDLIAVGGDGRCFRLDKDGNVENVTGVPVSGGHRVMFSKSDQDLLMAAGGPLVAFAGTKTRLLSKDAPESTHVGFIDSYVLAIEKATGTWRHSNAGDYDTWDDEDSFAASSTPDDINALLVTPFREIFITGEDSVEQFDRNSSGDTPFFRRWSLGQGIKAPYALVFADNSLWGVSSEAEFIRFSGQVSVPVSDDVQRSLEGIDDWTDAWAEEIRILGQKFISAASTGRHQRLRNQGHHASLRLSSA